MPSRRNHESRTAGRRERAFQDSQTVDAFRCPRPSEIPPLLHDDTSLAATKRPRAFRNYVPILRASTLASPSRAKFGGFRVSRMTEVAMPAPPGPQPVSALVRVRSSPIPHLRPPLFFFPSSSLLDHHSNVAETRGRPRHPAGRAPGAHGVPGFHRRHDRPRGPHLQRHLLRRHRQRTPSPQVRRDFIPCPCAATSDP